MTVDGCRLPAFRILKNIFPWRRRAKAFAPAAERKKLLMGANNLSIKKKKYLTGRRGCSRRSLFWENSWLDWGWVAGPARTSDGGSDVPVPVGYSTAASSPKEDEIMSVPGLIGHGLIAFGSA
jgi:hypothetical protein